MVGGLMKENGKKLLRYDLLVVSLLSSVDCEVVVSGFLWVVLVLAAWFWGWIVLQKGWREMVCVWKDRLGWKRMGQHFMAAFSLMKVTGISLLEKRNKLMERDCFHSKLWSENRPFRLYGLSSAVACRNCSRDSMNSGNQEFVFPNRNGSAAVGKILLVEDIEINRILLRKLSRDLNLLLEEAENGQIAVDYFKQGKKYDLVLMDKEMPVMDGHEATRQLRSLGVKTPIVALTGNSLQSDRDMFFQAGADEFQTKPLSREALVRLLARYGLDCPVPTMRHTLDCSHE